MHIANPIYDVVFKYLMDDNKIAKLLISAIIGEEIISLEYRPQERIAKLQKPTISKRKKPIVFFTIYRLDFSATIKTTKGEQKKVIIEIQKAKFATDIMRFRKYLGEQYASEENVYMVKERAEKYKKALPILNIYFLGNKLQTTLAPVIHVKRKYYDVSNGNEIKTKEEFIESLTHDSFIIQIPRLKEKRRTELEILLSIFDQSNISENRHILNIKEEDFPKKYQPIIRRLIRAIAEPKMKDTMDIEDEILEELSNNERTIAGQAEIIKEKDKTIEELRRKLKGE